MNTRQVRVLATLVACLSLFRLEVWAWSSKLNCPDTIEPSHQKEVIATSAPEVKVRVSAQNDGKQWIEITRPLALKAIKLAKKSRSEQIQSGVESSCAAGQVFVGQVVPLGDKPSGCEHHVVTRPAEDNYIYVQVIATCRYDWACCGMEVPAPLKSGTTAGYVLEGPLSQPNTPKK